MFYKRPLVYAMFSLMVTTAPAAVLADAAGSNPECRSAHRLDRPEVPVWVQERRAEREAMRQSLFSGPMGRGHTARMTRPAMPVFSAPQVPSWVTERRAQMPAFEAPQLPDWVAERRAQMPMMRQMPAFEAPQLPDWVAERRAQMPTFERPKVPDWVKEHRAQMPMSNWQTLPQVAPARPYIGAPVYGAPGWGGYDNGYGYNHRGPWGWHVPVAPVALASVDETPTEVVEVEVEVAMAMAEPEPVEVAASAPAPAPAPEAPVVTDSDADGVLDSVDMCLDSTAGATVDALGCEQNVAIVLRGVNFKIDSDELTDDSVGILDRVAATLVANPDIAVEVSGHTDSDGDAVYNKDLSQRRAETVMAYLVINGVTADNLSAMGYGEENPMVGNDSLEGKAQNRRVELSRK
ncbi:hypothetical protein DJ031_05420 [bacterium endosymbiont of Escarpia laminata]|nr:MAG: hypothetical protein DJ031_05420 [bacterium endosymbiont of Escarpia laminata]